MVMNKITAKIHDETAAEVKTILDEAQKKANASAARIEAAAQTKVQEIQVQAKADAEEAGRRQVLIAELESRKNALNLKRKVLDEAFAAAETKLQQLPQADVERQHEHGYPDDVERLFLHAAQRNRNRLQISDIRR